MLVSFETVLCQVASPELERAAWVAVTQGSRLEHTGSHPEAGLHTETTHGRPEVAAERQPEAEPAERRAAWLVEPQGLVHIGWEGPRPTEEDCKARAPEVPEEARPFRERWEEIAATMRTD